MRLNRTVVATLAAACMAVPVFGQATANDGKTETATQQVQLEQLQRNVSRLQAELDALKQQQEVVKAAQPAANPQEVEQLQHKVDALEQEVSKRTGLSFDLNPRPGWEKPAGWMTPSFRAEEMDLRVGTFGSIDMYLGLQSAGRFQILDDSDVFVGGVESPNLDPSFQTAWGDLPFMFNIDNGKMLVFFDLYLSSRPHPSTTYGNEGYILIRELPDNLPGNEWINNTIFKFVNVKAGHFEIDFGDAHYRRSDNAWVQRNLLIGNYLVDPDVEEIGMEIFGKDTKFNWLFGLSSGTTTENFVEGRGIASLHGKLWGYPMKDLRLSASGYYVDHSDNPLPSSGPPAVAGTKGSLFSGRRSGGPYGGVMGGGNSPGDLLLGNDKQVTALQGDVTWNPGSWDFYGHFGWMKDADLNGSALTDPEDRWIYAAIEGAYHFTPRAYVAARYCYAAAQELRSVDSDGHVQRIQLGGGYWLTKNVLAKAEYVYEKFSDFDPTSWSNGVGVDVSRDPSFSGLIFEVSFGI